MPYNALTEKDFFDTCVQKVSVAMKKPHMFKRLLECLEECGEVSHDSRSPSGDV